MPPGSGSRFSPCRSPGAGGTIEDVSQPLRRMEWDPAPSDRVARRFSHEFLARRVGRAYARLGYEVRPLGRDDDAPFDLVVAGGFRPFGVQCWLGLLGAERVRDLVERAPLHLVLVSAEGFTDRALQLAARRFDLQLVTEGELRAQRRSDSTSGSIVSA
jgi:hypothetical protein